MRKQLKIKRRSCKMCKPHKMGWARRWNAQEAACLRRFERERAAEMKFSDAWREDHSASA